MDQLRSPSSTTDGEVYDPSKDSIVGVLEGSFFWRDLIKNILPENTNGVVVVFQNPCNPDFTYQIDGPKAIFLGRGDLHDAQYDDQLVQSNFFELRSFSVGSSKYAGPPIDQEFCPFTLSVYPSDVMKEKYTTANPMIFTIIVLLIFVFTTAVFLLYDAMVERRQALVLNTAERSTAVVASLFPQDVRDRLADAVAESNTKKGFEKRNKSPTSAADYFADQDVNNDVSEVSRSVTTHGIHAKTPPIASLYSDTTIMFADIAGFTQWSSTRSPVDVFTLLETLYGGFDMIAKRRKVFKVETIGDCYVAVTGLPNPQKTHALIMARFARDCRAKMNELTTELAVELGEDTRTLALRTGLHSGPTTAGVL